MCALVNLLRSQCDCLFFLLGSTEKGGQARITNNDTDRIGMLKMTVGPLPTSRPSFLANDSHYKCKFMSRRPIFMMGVHIFGRWDSYIEVPLSYMVQHKYCVIYKRS